ncbi:MAG: LPS export ABC transporter periplasmic protein LptC [Pseudomonadota bacterium]
MLFQENLYSKLVAWTKIILPLTALGILSTLFLFSQSVDPTASIPLSEIDLEQRAQDQGATKATFAGVTDEGDEVVINAAVAKPSVNDPRLIEAEKVRGQMRLQRGGVVDMVSDQADVHQNQMTVVLRGNVNFVTTSGYDMRTELLNTRIDELFAESPGQVYGEGPPGNLVAGRMVLTHDESTKIAHLRFTDGVKLIYKPQSAEEGVQ